MSNQPIVFNVRYTPFMPPANATADERAAHAEERAFYNMTGEKNIYKYMTTEGKVNGINDSSNRSPPGEVSQDSDKTFTMFEYLQKSTKVFNQKGMIPEDEIEKMKERAKNNKGNIWHGFISFNEEESPKIDTPEKCIDFVRNTFNTFFKEAKLDEKNLDLMCSLHLDRPHHLHIHFTFWEKEPKYRSRFNDELIYRRKGKLDMKAIDNMFVKSGIWIEDGKDRLYKSRQNATEELKKLTHPAVAMMQDEKVRKAILSIAKDLPKTGRLSYGSKDMEPFRERVDEIVGMLLKGNADARWADRVFYTELARRKQVIKNICNQPFAFSDENVSPAEMEKNLPKYHHTIDDSNIHIVEDIEADYKRRMGNTVLKLAQFIKPEIYERPRLRQKASNNKIKQRIHISERKTGKLLDAFMKGFGKETAKHAAHARNRLREIEEEIAREQGRQENTEKEEAYRN